MKSYPLFAATASIAIALIAIEGCNRESSSASPSGTSPDAAKLKIVYIPKNTGNPYFTEVNKGFEDAAKEFNLDFTTTGPAKAEETSQLPIIKEQIQRGVDVIAISANSPDALNLALDEARNKGIMVITVDSDLTGNESHRDAAVLPADFATIGPGQVELMGSLIGYEGDIAILSATSNAPNQNAWIAKMKDELAKPKYAKMHLVETVYGDDEPQKSTTECEALLTKHPTLRGIISPTSVGLAAAAQVLERVGSYPGGPHAVGKGLQLTGLSTPNQLKKFVKEGVVTSFQLWAPANEGYLAGFMAQYFRKSKTKPAPGEKFTAGKLGEKVFSPKTEAYGGTLVTFDKSNVANYDF